MRAYTYTHVRARMYIQGMHACTHTHVHTHISAYKERAVLGSVSVLGKCIRNDFQTVCVCVCLLYVCVCVRMYTRTNTGALGQCIRNDIQMVCVCVCMLYVCVCLCVCMSVTDNEMMTWQELRLVYVCVCTYV